MVVTVRETVAVLLLFLACTLLVVLALTKLPAVILLAWGLPFGASLISSGCWMAWLLLACVWPRLPARLSIDLSSCTVLGCDGPMPDWVKSHPALLAYIDLTSCTRTCQVDFAQLHLALATDALD